MELCASLQHSAIINDIWPPYAVNYVQTHQ